MHEHIEALIVGLAAAMHRRGAGHGVAHAEPRRRRPRVARSTYIPTRQDPGVPSKLAH